MILLPLFTLCSGASSGAWQPAAGDEQRGTAVKWQEAQPQQEAQGQGAQAARAAAAQWRGES